jgi:glycosyltransferase involved in cell wall biosynthesis
LVEDGRPLVYGVSDDWLTYAPVLDAWTRMFAKRRLLGAAVEAVGRVPTRVADIGRSGAFCFISDFTRRRAEEKTVWSFPLATVVYSGIDRTLYPPPADPEAAAARVAERAWSGRLLYAGRYDARKGIETLLAAIPLLPDVALEIQGTGDEGYKRTLEAMVVELGIGDRVEFGAVRRDELPERYRAADLVVFPSEWDEPFGLVPVEAMSCGTPVIGTGTGGSAEFLLDGINCVRFAAGDPEDLAAAVRRVAGDAGLRRRMVTAGFATADDLDVEHLTDTDEAWHAAAADRYASGRPPDRHLEVPAPPTDMSSGG